MFASIWDVKHRKLIWGWVYKMKSYRISMIYYLDIFTKNITKKYSLVSCLEQNKPYLEPISGKY